ncbi:hypothetical protein BD324DRAFT_651717 [Kockovaella imperatae]|uniref:PH domain-containing protein n=1 Tax=Kockovaella imperatae TaxID=4999 RepID=A0A1Y1UER1_9TREE|nr:hypothetical protein BD324DRAFT_651717 [Kockovaella imperatae]ORX36479.1 hypothetical protein BD324DRAFT_651717 [Kockovaella imperatae]
MSISVNSPHLAAAEGSSIASQETSSTSAPALTFTSSSSITDGGPSHRRTPSSSVMSSSRGRFSARAATMTSGPALGLEEEVQFGSNEDLLENIGEIDIPDSGWYTTAGGEMRAVENVKGKSRSGTQSKSGSDDRETSGRRKGTFLSAARAKAANEGYNKGIGDAKILSMDELEAPLNQLNRVDTASSRAHAMPFDDGASMMSSMTGGTGSDKKDKTKKKMFAKLFGGGGSGNSNSSMSSRKESHRASIVSVPSRLPPGVSAPSKFTEQNTMSSRQESVPGVTPPQSSLGNKSRSSVQPGLSPLATSGSITHPSALVSNMPRPSSGESTTAVKSLIQTGSKAIESSSDSFLAEEREGSVAAQGSSSEEEMPKPVPTLQLVHFLLPSFPTSPSSVESTTILSSMVMRRLGGLASSRSRTSLRPGTGSSSGSQGKKAIWQSHQLVLRSFRLEDPAQGSSSSSRAGSGARTIAHLHLFSTITRAKSGQLVKVQSWAQSTDPSEVERRSISQQTMAGVWDVTSDGENKKDSSDKVRKWVMRVTWEDEEWLCDMPNRDALLEWIKQIKKYATIIRAESLGFGPQIQHALSQGSRVDLALELDMLRKGLRGSSNNGQSPMMKNRHLLAGNEKEEIMDERDPDSSGTEGIDPSAYRQAQRVRQLANRSTSLASMTSRRSSLHLENMPAPAPAPTMPLPLLPPSSLAVEQLADHQNPMITPGSAQPSLDGRSESIHSDLPETPVKHEFSTSPTTDSLSSRPSVSLLTPSDGGEKDQRESSMMITEAPTPGFYTPSIASESGATQSTFLFPTPPQSMPVQLPHLDHHQQHQHQLLELKKARFVDYDEFRLKGAMDRAETASITSTATGSTSNRRRLRAKTPAVDLMAEFANRPEANFEESTDDLPMPDSSRSRRIRFAG